MIERPSPGRAALLLARGGDDPDRLQRRGGGILWSGTTDLFRLVKSEVRYDRLNVTRNLLRAGRRVEIGHYDCIVNLIAEPERNSRSLDNLRKLLRGFPGRVINRPEAVIRTGREQVARLLDGIDGLVVPKTVRLPARQTKNASRAIGRAGLDPPIILRQAGTHSGRIVGRFDTAAELAAAIEPGPDHILTEFVDFAGADGLYRKLRAFSLGGRWILRHQLASDHWNVHAKDRARFMAGRPELVAEERRLFEDGEGCAALGPPVERTLASVAERMPLDFFGIDFGILPDGRMLLFEANAAMSFFPFSDDPQFAYLRSALEPARTAFRDLLDLPEPIPAIATLAGQAIRMG